MAVASLLLLVCAGLQGQPSDPLIQRLVEEAEAFARLAPKVLGQETLEQVALQPGPRFQARAAPPKPVYGTRRIESEYGFAYFADDPGNLHELRQVLSVDGRVVRAPGKLRETLAMGLKGDTDKAKRKLLKDFESHGLRESATDFGQVILLFTQRQVANYRFQPERRDRLGPDIAKVYRYEQLDTAGSAMTVFEGRQVVRYRLQGELWLRESDGLPLRVTLDAARREKEFTIQYRAAVDYLQSAHGMVLPVAVTYAEMLKGLMLIENRFRYSDFKFFGASSEVKFTPEETPPDPPPAPVKK